jgi:aspartyl-tRNA(Asn)/glutamyl-tRNA(Gln) amidotransferase subunit A
MARLGELYRSGRITPLEVAKRVLALAAHLDEEGFGPLCDVLERDVLRDAQASTERYARGAPLSEFDGVPYAVKEQIAVAGLPRRLGTAFISTAPLAEDATVVARLRALGAVVVGLTPMTEFGMTPSGANPLRRMPRNPNHRERLPGGSSSGSGVAVATGLVPFTLGADGGGSVRIPSSLNGVFGIKPTWGRMTRYGDPSGGTVAHLGPLACSTWELARVLEATCARDELDRETREAPPVGDWAAQLGQSVRGLVIGVERKELADAPRHISSACEQALLALEKEGAILRDIEIPLAPYAPAIGYITIAIEARAGLRTQWREHADEMSDDLQVAFSSLDAFSALDYADTQRLRTGLRQQVASVFRDVDALALPTTQTTAPHATDAERASGFLDPKLIDALCRFNFMGNLTGLPAASLPVAMDGDGLPIGLQIMGDAWDEGTVLRVGSKLEQMGAAFVRRPESAVQVLP